MQKDTLEIERGRIFNGRQRKLTFLALENSALLVSELTRKVNSIIPKGEKTLTLREVSRALKWLAANHYAKCLNPSHKQGVKGILYKLTEKGKRIKKLLEQKNFYSPKLSKSFIIPLFLILGFFFLIISPF